MKDVMPASRRDNRVMFIKLWLPVLLWTGVIFYSSSVPAKDIPPLFPFQDILFHFAIYMLLAYLFHRAIKNTYPKLTLKNLITITVIFGFSYGLSDEFHQIFVPGRFASGLDLLIDGIGSFAGSLLYPVRKNISIKVDGFSNGTYR